MAFVHTLRVRYAECDMQGHAYNGHYLTWFDIAHTEMIRAVFGRYEDIVAQGVEFVVAEANVRYRAPARFDEDIDIHVLPEEPGETSLTSNFEVRRGADLLAEGWIRHVCVDAESFAKKAWPEGLRSAFRKVGGAG
ncbi:MAG: acyl-CoA thioesterase [Thermoleophilaceae bacterium]|nr:acyl-CoA thioesterase [Thermoleophilaceae bacterium]